MQNLFLELREIFFWQLVERCVILRKMKAKKKEEKNGIYTSVKIRTEHYLLVKNHKANTGINMDFFIGEAIVEKLQKEKK